MTNVDADAARRLRGNARSQVADVLPLRFEADDFAGRAEPPERRGAAEREVAIVGADVELLQGMFRALLDVESSGRAVESATFSAVTLPA